jgi:tetratricopeptide (TPR) repeat protein
MKKQKTKPDNRSELDKARQFYAEGKYQEVLAVYTEEQNLSPRALLIRGLAQVKLGDGENGRSALQAGISFPPNENCLAWYSDYGLACLILGKIKDAADYLKDLDENPEATALDYSRIAALRLIENELAQAEQYYREAVLREPGQADWHNNLAGILVRQQKFEEALEHYDIALRLNPDLEQAQLSRQRVYIALERTEDLVHDLIQRIKDNPEDHFLKIRLARAYDLDNRPAEALKLLKKELIPVSDIPCNDPEQNEVYNAQYAYRWMISEIFINRSMYGKALTAINQLEEMNPVKPVPVFVRKAQILAELGSFEKALALLDSLETDHSENNQIKSAKANILCEKGDYASAESILRELLETYPGDAGLLTQLGQTLLWVGDLDEAADCFERASEINPMALAQMVNARKIPEDPRALEKMRSFADNPLQPDIARQNMNFALSTVHDKKKDYETAFHYLSQANRLANKSLNYVPQVFTRKTRAVANVFSREFFEGLEPIRKSNRIPIFVVGMPRSGTTLTEQILSSHPDIFGAGELPIIPKLTMLMPLVLKVRHLFPMCVRKMTPHLREEAARHYLYNLNEYNSEHLYVVDKMPHNFVNLGLIAAIFPKAKIIHVNRDPRDTAVSNFQQSFKARHGGLGYAFDLKNIALQINDYYDLMQHWRKVLPLPIFDLSYEQMVQDMEGTARKLLQFVGVNWHEDVNQFYETKRAVRTASVSQVRQPIYKTSMKKWKHYEKHLGGLLDNLNPQVTKYWDNPADENTPYENKIFQQGRMTRLDS